MDALKLIPQAFFEFFARLVPGGVAVAIWMTLFDGARRWPVILETLAAGRLDRGNVSVFALFVAISIAYGIGQLVAPLGKAAQRVTEFLAVPVARILIRPRNWARGILRKEAVVLPERWRSIKRKQIVHSPPVATSWILIAVRFVDIPTTWPKSEKNNYDYLRANAPELGALVAKIRSEYTMFNALTAIFAISAVAYVAAQPTRLWPTLPLLTAGSIICAGRGYFVEKTMGQTAKKLRSAFDQGQRLKEDRERQNAAVSSQRQTRNAAKKQLMSALQEKAV